MNTLRLSLLVILSFALASGAFAQPVAGSSGAIDVNVIQDPQVTRAINSLIAGYGQDRIEKDLYPKRADDDPIKAISKVFSVVYPEKVTAPLAPNDDPIKDVNSVPYMADLNNQALYDMLTTINPKQTTGWVINKVPAPDFAHPCERPIFSNGQHQCPDATPVNLNMDSLVRPTQYEKEQQVNARNLIRFITGMAAPPAALNFGKLSTTDREAVMKDPKVQQYLLALRTLTAMSSVGISNLYYLYAERIPIKMDNPNPKDTDRPKIEISPLQAQQEMASRRLRDPDWIAKMEAAAPATLQREMLYLLAEIRFELFQARMVNERILATQSVVQVQNAAATPQAMTMGQQFTEISGAPPFTPKTTTETK